MADERDDELDTGTDADRPVTEPWSPDDLGAAHRPQARTLGRFVVLEEIGRGGMGLVLRAYDPKLEREVALKLLRTEVLDAESQSRLVREAKAMARLSHPNVVAVYDVEDTPAGVVLVMEHVRGMDLRGWLRLRPRSWSEIVDRFIEAGWGLVAAHDEGLLHRDFKPGNILVPQQGVAKVTDFGLAKLASATGPPKVDTPVEDMESLDGTLTQDGMVMGTPRYMAPEQHLQAPLGPAADQYAFCVTLWEALTGEPPFQGSAGDMAVLKHNGPPAWPEHVKLPRWLVDALRRGLAVEPAERWPSMEDLLQTLARTPSRRRNRWLGAVVLVGVLGLGISAAWAWSEALARRCTGAAEQLTGIWDDARRAEVEAALLDSGATYAPYVWSRLEPRLSEHAQAWVQMHTEACEATTVRGEQSTRILELRMTCLSRVKQELRATVDVLAEADAEVVRRAHEVVGDLRGLERCADVEALDREPESAAEHVEAVQRAEVALAQTRAERLGGRYDAARHSLERAEAALHGVDHAPAHAELELERGRLLETLGDYEASDAALRDALEAGIRAGHREVTRDAAIMLLHVVGNERALPEQALRYRELAVALAEGDDQARADLHNSLGNLRQAQGHYAEAEQEHRSALVVWRGALGPEHPRVADVNSNLAVTLAQQGKLNEAEEQLRTAIELRTKALGAEHPDVANARLNLASTLRGQGHNAEAEAEMRQVIPVLEQSLGPDHFGVARARANLANILWSLDDEAGAQAELHRAIEIVERTHGPDHPELGAWRSDLAAILRSRGALPQAEPPDEEGIEEP